MLSLSNLSWDGKNFRRSEINDIKSKKMKFISDKMEMTPIWGFGQKPRISKTCSNEVWLN